MQNYPDLKLQCCDCQEKFHSASRLLQHFAEHILKGKPKHERRKKRKAKGEAESGSDSNQSQQSASTSYGSEVSEPCKLARFDLQERLESTVGADTFITVKSEPPDDTELSDVASVSADTKASEEYSPLKFCMITMEENSENVDTESPKKAATRKQLAPKKIERKTEGLRKLAPKLDAKVSNEPLSHSSHRKKYACHLCTKVFGWSTDLKRHILVHTGERPFKCENCQATFTRNFLLQKHQSKVHPCKPKNPTVAKPESSDVPKREANVAIVFKEEVVSNDEYEDDDDDEHRLVITEESDEKPLPSSISDSSWRLQSDRRCSKLKQPDNIFGATPLKVLTT